LQQPPGAHQRTSQSEEPSTGDCLWCRRCRSSRFWVRRNSRQRIQDSGLKLAHGGCHVLNLCRNVEFIEKGEDGLDGTKKVIENIDIMDPDGHERTCRASRVISPPPVFVRSQFKSLPAGTIASTMIRFPRVPFSTSSFVFRIPPIRRLGCPTIKTTPAF